MTLQERLRDELSRIADGGDAYEGGTHTVIMISQNEALELRDALDAARNPNA